MPDPRADHVGRVDHAVHRARRRAGGLVAAATQERDHAAVRGRVVEVDESEEHVPALEVVVSKRVSHPTAADLGENLP